jgi:hypothetical protein
MVPVNFFLVSAYLSKTESISEVRALVQQILSLPKTGRVVSRHSLQFNVGSDPREERIFFTFWKFHLQ